MKNILITGANKGIGLEFVKKLSSQDNHIIATCRDPESADELQSLAQATNNISIEKLDITDDNNISVLAHSLESTPLDWLINNAGISGDQGVTIGNVDRDNFLNVIEVNSLSTAKVSEAFLPHLKKSTDKLIVCISSRMGSISDNDRGRSYAYRTSKAALNCLMRSFAIDVAKEDIKVILVHPGWVKTGMGGSDAQLEPDESVNGLLNVIENNKENSHADVLWRYDGSIINW